MTLNMKMIRNKWTRNLETKSRELSLNINEIENLTPNVISYKRRIFCIAVFKRKSRHSM